MLTMWLLLLHGEKRAQDEGAAPDTPVTNLSMSSLRGNLSEGIVLLLHGKKCAQDEQAAPDTPATNLSISSLRGSPSTGIPTGAAILHFKWRSTNAFAPDAALPL